MPEKFSLVNFSNVHRVYVSKYGVETIEWSFDKLG